MKVSIYKTLLLVLITLVSSCGSQQNKAYKDFYEEANKNHNAPLVHDAYANRETGTVYQTVRAGQMKQSLNDLAGVTAITTKYDESILNKTITTESGEKITLSAALTECVTPVGRTPDAGKAKLEPRVLPEATLNKKAVPTAENKTELKTPASVGAAALESVKDSEVGSTAKSAATTTSAPSSTQSRSINDTDWKLFRAVDVTLLNQSDQALMKKYSIVLGTFKSKNNAEFIQRTFNGVGERSFVVRNNAGSFYALLGSFDNETEAIQKLEDINKRYVDGVSRTRRISRFGITMDDLWVIILK